MPMADPRVPTGSCPLLKKSEVEGSTRLTQEQTPALSTPHSSLLSRAPATPGPSPPSGPCSTPRSGQWPSPRDTQDSPQTSPSSAVHSKQVAWGQPSCCRGPRPNSPSRPDPAPAVLLKLDLSPPSPRAGSPHQHRESADPQGQAGTPTPHYHLRHHQPSSLYMDREAVQGAGHA